MAHIIKQYDNVILRWSASVELDDAESIRFLMSKTRRPDPPVVDKIATLDPEDPKVIEVLLSTEDTSTPGKYNIEFETVWPDGQIVTFPAKGYERITIQPDLGGHLEEESP